MVFLRLDNIKKIDILGLLCYLKGISFRVGY